MCENGSKPVRYGLKEGQKMKVMLNLGLALLLVLVVVLACGKSTPTLTDEELYEASAAACGDEDCRKHAKWCDQIYHQNVGCPLNGKMEIPAEVLERQETEYLAWCNSIGNKNASCPGYDATLAE
jgi:hypothetical protein